MTQGAKPWQNGTLKMAVTFGTLLFFAGGFYYTSSANSESLKLQLSTACQNLNEKIDTLSQRQQSANASVVGRLSAIESVLMKGGK